ncbi:MAG: phospholipase D family protein, partial [Xanthomonadales bacterium]|nr:phospholipase D family protein [Xanthomonadales bacterium]
EFAPGSAYRLSLDERGKVLWTLDLPDGTQSWTHDPEASIWKRFLATLIGWLPIEQEL